MVAESVEAAIAGAEKANEVAISEMLKDAAQMPRIVRLRRIAPQRDPRLSDRRTLLTRADLSPTGWPINEIPRFRWDAGMRQNTIEDASNRIELIALTPSQSESPSILRLPSHPNV